MKLPCTLKLRHTGSSNHGRGGEGAMITENLSCTLAASVQDQTLFTGGGTLCYDGYNQRGHEEVSMTLRSAMTWTEGNDADPKVAYGINPQGGGMNPCDEELGETQSVCHQGGVMQVNDNDLLKMRYIVRRLSPTECMRLMGLPDDYCIPTGLRRFFDADGEPSPELVAEFQRTFDTFGAIMYEYALASYERSHREGEPPPEPPKPKSAKQVAAWLKKISDPATCPDSPIYKGAGNGWATNQPRWILTRLLAMEGHEL